MLPESIRAEIEAKGGLRGDPEPQGNGTTIYRAASGDYVVVDDRTGQPRMRGFSPPTEGAPMASPQPPASSPATAPNPPGSGSMTQQQLEELLKQIAPNNDPRRLEFNQITRKKTVTTGSGILASTQTVDVPVVQWIDRATGQTLEADVNDDGTYTVTKNARVTSHQGQAATTAAQQQASQPQSAEVKTPVEGRPGWTKITRKRVENGNTTESTVFVGPDGKEVSSLPAETKTDRKPVTGQPGVYIVSTTTGGKSETHFENEAGQTIPSPPNLPQTITANGITYIRGGDGNYAPAPGIPQPGATAKNVDPFTPDFTDPAADLGLGKWAAAQRKKIGLPAEQGGITQKEYDDAVTAAHASATTSISNITSSQGVTRQQAIDEETRRQQQRSEAASDYTTAQGRFNERWQYMNPDKPGIGSYISTTAEELARARKAREGNARPMPALHPMFTGGMGASVVPASAPAPTAPAPPNAIGLGRPGAVFTPGGTPAPAPAPSVAAAPPAPSGIVSPALALPTEPPPAAPAVGVNPDAGQALGPTGNSGPLSMEPGVNPDAGQALGPTGDSGPLGTPAVGSSVNPDDSPDFGAPGMRVLPQPPVTPPLPPGEVTMAPPTNPALTAVRQQADLPMFNPIEVGGRLVGLGVPSDAIAQAMLELGYLNPQEGAA